jgi:hypothetical protein
MNDSNLIGELGVGNWYGAYEQSVVGPHAGASLWQASDDYAGAPGSPIPNEIWYDSAGATACPEWNYWACQYTSPPTQPQVPAAYAIDYYARPGSGTLVASARDTARFMMLYSWGGTVANLTNSITGLQPAGVGGGALPGVTTIMADAKSFYNGQPHYWAWVLLANRDVPFDAIAFDGLLDNSSGSGVFDTYQPTTDLYVDSLLQNRWALQYAYANSTTVPRVDYVAGNPTSSNPYFPYNTLPGAEWLWRILPVGNGYSQITNEQMSGLMMSNHDNDGWVELLSPNDSLHSYYWSLVQAPDLGWTQIMSRAVPANGLHVQDQKGYVEQGPIQSTWWSADWQMFPQPSGLCCTNMTSEVSCPSNSTACPCGSTPTCPAYTP